MAKVVSDEIMNLKIIVNGDEAQKQVTDLEEANVKLSATLKELNAEQKQVDAERKKEEKSINSLADKIDKLKISLSSKQAADVEEIKILKNQQAAYDKTSLQYQSIQTKIEKVRASSVAGTKGLENSIQSLTGQQNKIKSTYDVTISKSSELKTKIAGLGRELVDNKLKISQTVASMDIMSLTSTQLNRKIGELAFTMKNMNPNLPAYKTAQVEMQRLRQRADELRTGAAASSRSIGSLADSFNRYQGIALAVTATMTGVALSLQSVIDLNNKLADAQTTVSKTTGMTKEEVDALTKSFSEFNTRSSRMDLLKISEIGGRLGVPKQEIKDFTQEVDKAYVALGDGFTGGVEAVANKLGKIKGLFKETKDLQIATAMNQIGSAMNELGAAGAASEENIAEFVLRVGSLPNALKPTIGDALALGAAFEESGIDAERAGTAYTNFISTAAKNTKGFAEVMRVPEKQIKDLINTNPTEFFLQFANGLKGMDATDLAKTLEYLKLNDQYVKGILGSASENTDKFRASMELSNRSLIEATSLQEEFNKVNNNAAAVYDKVRKKFIGMFTSETVAKSLNWIISAIGKLIGAVDDADGKYRAFANTFIFMTKIITIAVVSIFSYNAALILSGLTLESVKAKLLSYTIIQKVNNLLNQSGALFQNLYTASMLRAQIAYYKLTGATAAQTLAQQRLNLMTKANPWGALLAVVVAIGAAYLLFAKRTNEAAEAQRALNDVKTTATKKVIDEKVEIEKLVAVLKSEITTNEQRENALKKLNSIIPDHIGLLTAQNIKTAEGVGIINRYIDALNRQAYAQALTDKKKELLSKQLDIQSNDIDKGWQDVGGVGTFLEKGLNRGSLKGEMTSSEAKQLDAMKSTVEVEKNLAKYIPLVQNAYRKRREELIANTNQYKVLDAEQKKMMLTDPGAFLGDTTPDYKTDFGGPAKATTTKKTQFEKDSDSAKKAYENMRKKILDSAENFDQKELERAAKLEDAKADIMQEGFLKEYLQIKADEQKQLADIEKEKYSDKDYQQIDRIIAKEKGALKKQFESIKEEWKRNDADYSSMQLLETEKTKFKLATLNEKYTKLALKKQEDDLKKLIDGYKDQTNIALFENDTVEKQRAFLAGFGYSEDSLKKIRTWEEGRKEIEKYYQQKTLEDQVNFLKKKIQDFNVLMALNVITISPEQLDQIQKYKEQINELLAEITKLKNGESSGNSADFSSLKNIGGEKDILGLSPVQWQAMFTNTSNLETNIQKVGAAVQVAQQMFAAYYEFMAANEEAALRRAEYTADRKKRTLKTQLATGYINQETYKRLDLEADLELDKKKAEIEYNAAKRQKTMAISQVITSTALGIMNIWATQGINPIVAGILTGVVGSLGALQLATIIKQPLPIAPGAEEGYYPTIREQDGKMFNARRKRSSTGMYNEPTMLVGEGGASMPELVVSGRDLKRINPNIQRQYMQEISRVKGFEDGLYPSAKSSGNDEIMIEMIKTMKEFREVMQDIKDYGIEAKIAKTARTGKDLKEVIKSYEKLDNKSKH